MTHHAPPDFDPRPGRPDTPIPWWHALLLTAGGVVALAVVAVILVGAVAAIDAIGRL